MNRSEIALLKFKNGYNCAQSVIYSYHNRLNIDADLALKLSNGFGGGFGRKQITCGAISGATLVLGLLYGRGENDDISKHEQTYSKVQELINQFEATHKTTNCSELLDECNLLDKKGQERFKSENMIEKCYEYVEHIVTILDQIIDLDQIIENEKTINTDNQCLQ